MKKTGFTLIEMMIVVAMIGIIISIAWPFITGRTGNPANSEGVAKQFAETTLSLSEVNVSCVDAQNGFMRRLCTVSGMNRNGQQINETLDCRENGCVLQRGN